MTKMIKRKKVVNIKTKEPVFSEWLKDVTEQNDLADVQSALIIWSTPKEGNWARLNVSTQQLEYYIKILNDILFEQKIEEFMEERIGDFIEYIE